ncbi:prepilin-type N-terminal cleavage/methylation domain-containing protein [Desulfitobacterium sp.]|uniref:prepilin-type N-terminal cleavage/methylation domain-containing protein n=1 Tax=Desulfitobacterium sp. TaxID=49981 RepID=UPI002B205303|nr:prepilin-type N-terminal cleavage/methylation domain-containing protein [Desulfitobacterium sp.]MEA4900444.1 prepilin-type N-terminal cleavage/methylation domain-containing protein [Desulfitobacterium sp.]
MKRASAGFTLIELMIVISVIGILAAVTVPHYQSLKDYYQLETASSNVLLRLRQAKQMAMDERKNIGVALTASDIQLMNVTVEKDEMGKSRPTGMQEITPSDRYIYDSGIIFVPDSSQNLFLMDSGQYLIYFDYRGFLQTNPSGSSGVIALKSTRSSQQVGVELEAGTGKMEISWP